MAERAWRGKDKRRRERKGGVKKDASPGIEPKTFSMEGYNSNRWSPQAPDCMHVLYRHNYYIANLDCHELRVASLAALAPPISSWHPKLLFMTSAITLVSRENGWSSILGGFTRLYWMSKYWGGGGGGGGLQPSGSYAPELKRSKLTDCSFCHYWGTWEWPLRPGRQLVIKSWRNKWQLEGTKWNWDCG